MRAILALLLSLLLAPAWAQVPMTGAGKGTPAAAYQGPGDVFGSASSWYSCSRAYNAAYATGSNPACDLVDTATGTVTYTMNILSTGFADAAGAAASSACATACSIIKVYDQTGNGRHMLQSTATLAQLPHLTFNSSPTGTLPAINCGNGSSVFFLQATTSPLINSPMTFSLVANRNSGTAQGSVIGSNGLNSAGFGSGANLAAILGASGTKLTASATDSTWHAINGQENAASSAINVDGSETTGSLTAGSISANTIRLCRGGGQTGGLIAEAGVWAISSTSTDRNALSTNQHGTNGYNF